MRYGSVCSGIEAATVAWRPLGWSCAFVSEVEPFACAVLKARLPGVPNLGDFTQIQKGGYDGEIDLLVGGTSCQPFSLGGGRGGIADPRGGLAIESPTRAEASPSSLRAWLKGRMRDGWCGRTFQPSFPSMEAETSPRSSPNSRDGTSKSPSVDGGTPGSRRTRPGASAFRGECWTRSIPEFPHFLGRSRSEGVVSSLSDVVVPGRAPPSLCLAASYAEAMLRRAERRGYALPPALERVLRMSASPST